MPRSRKPPLSNGTPPKGGVGGDDIAFYMAEARKHKVMTRDEEKALAHKVRAGGPESMEARNEFVRRNMRLVVTIARKYTSEDMPLPDLVQEGCIGLMRALDKFDPDKGFKFSTYASWWIHQAMTRASQQADAIRIPVHQVDARNRVRRVERYYDHHFDRDPTDEEIVEATGLKPKAVQQARNLPTVGASLDDPTGDGDTTLAAFIEDEDAVDAELAVLVQDLREQSEKILDDLNERDRLIFTWRYGEEPMSLEEIGDKVGLTRERVRQILKTNKVSLRAKARKLGFG